VQPGDYVIGRQDLLQISVFQLDSLSQTVRVQEDGTISLPLVGELRVEGMTRRELEKSIAARLTPRYLLDPQVSVFVKEFQSKKVAVLGAVGRPGSFELIGTRTLLEMLSLAEGILKEQAGATIQIHRKGPNGQTHVIPIDFAALEGGVPTANVVVQGGDIIHVPVDDLLLIYVNGAVRRPDVFKVKRSEPLTVLRAVTMAGGINERGSERRVQVVRQQPDGTARVIPVDLKRIKKGKDPDIALEKNDVVVVPEAFF
jgi:polysaccharide export outer membrane protein